MLLPRHKHYNLARKECREWAEWDDIFVWVEDEAGDIIYSIDGYAEAME